MTTKQAAGWGGARQGAGRKPVATDQKRKKRSVYVNDTEWEAIRALLDTLRNADIAIPDIPDAE